MYGSKYNAHTEPLFKVLKILPLNALIKNFNLQFMQHFIQGFSPASFNSVWLTNEERRPEDMQRRILRNNDQLFVPFSLSKHPLISFLFHSQGYLLSCGEVRLIRPLINFPKTWLEFNCENIKILRNKIEFKTELKKHLLNELASVINCSRLLCPTCHLNA